MQGAVLLMKLCAYAHMYVHPLAHSHIYHTLTLTHTHTYTCTLSHLCTHIHTNKYTQTHTHTYAYTYINTYIYILTYTHTQHSSDVSLQHYIYRTVAHHYTVLSWYTTVTRHCNTRLPLPLYHRTG